MSSGWEAVIGLEVHAQLLTRSKLFCPCSTRYGAPPNTHVCPVCIGLPGALPVPNRGAIELAIRAALALGCTVREHSRFARKGYFYPDLAKGYQISQYELPLSEHGTLSLAVDGETVVARIRRIHVEEDAGKNVHGTYGDATLVDFNRAGVPLIEIVGDPDLRSAAQAEEYLVRLREVLMFVGVNDGNLEEGSFRCDANVSVRPRGSDVLGTRCEVKNINSFRFVRKALEHEIARQAAVVAAGGTIRQETLHWSEALGKTVPLRGKEEAQDYRYFPDPDLPPLHVAPAWVERVRSAMPELPADKRARYATELGLTTYDAEVLTSHPGIAVFFEAAAGEGSLLGVAPKTVANFVQSLLKRDLMKPLLSGEVNRLASIAHDLVVPPREIARLVALVARGTISNRQANDVLAEMESSGRGAEAVVAALGLRQESDESALRAILEKVVAGNEAQAAKLRAGKSGVRGFFVGAVMRETSGQANPAVVNRILDEMFGGNAS
ncbi:MAG: Asp-tRNA(Asn)/Glu-tRNA(Gln) amidotransferase subunit GatB [Deltaproteobacteria bacterium]|nr:Asp-tRNA(Asn)/Glu-tRNA(Gln) amidotransferase subunit GatB [Deltaproteobacteria bacterium]